MRPSEGRLSLWPVAVLAIVIVLALLSFDLPLRLRATTPQEFRTAVAKTTGKQNRQQADDYWLLAVNVVQWKYPFGSILPKDPPPEFALPLAGAAERRDGQAMRLQYWAALRQVWPQPAIWRHSLEFDVSWVEHSVDSVVDFVSALTGHSVT